VLRFNIYWPITHEYTYIYWWIDCTILLHRGVIWRSLWSTDSKPLRRHRDGLYNCQCNSSYLSMCVWIHLCQRR